MPFDGLRKREKAYVREYSNIRPSTSDIPVSEDIPSKERKIPHPEKEPGCTIGTRSDAPPTADKHPICTFVPVERSVTTFVARMRIFGPHDLPQPRSLPSYPLSRTCGLFIRPVERPLRDDGHRRPRLFPFLPFLLLFRRTGYIRHRNRATCTGSPGRHKKAFRLPSGSGTRKKDRRPDQKSSLLQRVFHCPHAAVAEP